MKNVKMFKMDLYTGEAKFSPDEKFNELNTILKLDILKDWLNEIQYEYNKELEKFLNEKEEVSNCCSEKVWENTDICTKCGEHCEIIDISNF
jgi:rRNA maturation protein Nop10